MVADVTTQDWTSEIVEAMARAMSAATWEVDEPGRGAMIADHFFEHSYMDDADKDECEDYRVQARAALTAALPMILEKVAKECLQYKHEREDARHVMGKRFEETGSDYYLEQAHFEDQRGLAAEELDRRIRALIEPKDNGGEK